MIQAQDAHLLCLDNLSSVPENSPINAHGPLRGCAARPAFTRLGPGNPTRPIPARVPQRQRRIAGPENGYFGTLKIARRTFPELTVPFRVAEKTRFRPLLATSFQPAPRVIRSPFRAVWPFIVIAAISHLR